MADTSQLIVVIVCVYKCVVLRESVREGSNPICQWILFSIRTHLFVLAQSHFVWKFDVQFRTCGLGLFVRCVWRKMYHAHTGKICIVVHEGLLFCVPRLRIVSFPYLALRPGSVVGAYALFVCLPAAEQGPVPPLIVLFFFAHKPLS